MWKPQVSQNGNYAEIAGFKERAILWVFVLSWFVFLSLGLVVFLTQRGDFCWDNWKILAGGILLSNSLFFVLVFGLGGLKVVEEEDRVVVQLLGKFYKIKGPGLIWVCPWLMRKRSQISIWEQEIPLFIKVDENGNIVPEKVTIDFRGGGTAKLVDPILWGRPIRNRATDEPNATREQRNEIDEQVVRESVYSMTYGVDDWGDACRENTETAFRTHLNNLTVEEAIEAVFRSNRETWWDELIENFPNLGNTMKRFGFEPTRLTLSDFEWDSKVVARRQEQFDAEKSIAIEERKAEAAKKVAIGRAHVTAGVLSGMIGELTGKKTGMERERVEKLCLDLLKYKEAADSGRLWDIRVGGNSGSESNANPLSYLLAEGIALFQGLKPQGQSQPRPQSKSSREGSSQEEGGISQEEQ